MGNFTTNSSHCLLIVICLWPGFIANRFCSSVKSSFWGVLYTALVIYHAMTGKTLDLFAIGMQFVYFAGVDIFRFSKIMAVQANSFVYVTYLFQLFFVA